MVIMGSKRAVDKSHWQSVADMYKNGNSATKIAEIFRCKSWSIYRILHILGVEIRKAGDARLNHPSQAMKYFLSKVSPEPNSGCWLWLGRCNKTGYAVMYESGGSRKVWLAHRWIYFKLNSLADRAMFVCHKCDNPSCVNPTHLFLGTHQDNMNDCVRKKRTRGFKQVCIRGHVLDEKNVRVEYRPEGKLRRCIECTREYNRSKKGGA